MILVLFTLVILAVSFILHEIWKPKNYPPGPVFIPIFGHIFKIKSLTKALGGQHFAFRYLADIYKTNVLGLKMGNSLTVIVRSHNLVTQVYTEEVFDGRPDNFFMRLRTMGKRRGITSTDGEVWNTQRTFIIKNLKTLGLAKEVISTLIKNEVAELIKVLPKSKSQIKDIIAPCVINIIWYLSTGSNIKNNSDRIKNVISLLNARSKAFDFNGGWITLFPWLRHIIPKQIGYDLICSINKELNSLFVETIQEHYNTWTEDMEDDLISLYIREIKAGKETFTEDQLVIVLLDLFIGGAQTTSTTLDFAFMMMILRPDVQEKLQHILDKEFDKNEPINYSDRHRVPYVEAVIMEVLRFISVTPLTGPRRALHDTMLDGYCIPKDTLIIMDQFSVNNDKSYWGNPEEFDPERFILKDGTLKTTDYAAPFGLGRRRCPGEFIARNCLFTFFSEIVRKYKLTQHPESEMPSLTFQPGIVVSPKPYLAKFTER